MAGQLNKVYQGCDSHLLYLKEFIVFKHTVVEDLSNETWDEKVHEIEKDSSEEDSNAREQDQVPRPAELWVEEDGAVLLTSIALGHVPREDHLWLIVYDEAEAEASQDHDEAEDGHNVGSIADVEDENKDVQKVDGERQPAKSSGNIRNTIPHQYYCTL